MPRTLVSDWKRVATSGKTVDGRTIEAQDLRDMASAYDPATYTATIWYEHIRYFGSLGTVAEVKAEAVAGDKVALFAKLQPNDRLLSLNKADQVLFSSIEIQPNFADTGKAYLRGMAVTDNPASLGTEALHFSSRAEAGNYFANLEPLDDLTVGDSEEAAALSFFARAFAVLRGKGDTDFHALTQEENTPMDQKTVQAFAAAVDKLGTVATSLETSAATFAAQKPNEPDTALTTDKTVDQPTGITVEQFNSLKGSLDSLAEKFNTALNHGKGHELPHTAGAVNDQPEAVY